MKLKLFFGLFLLSALSSCLTLIQPLATRNNIITDDRLVGQWKDQSSRKIIVQKFMDSEFKTIFKDVKQKKEDSVYYSKMYVIQVLENNYKYWWAGGVVNIADRKFINLLPITCTDKNDNVKEIEIDGKETGSIARLEYNNSTIKLEFLNGDYVKQILLNGKAHLRYEYDPLFGNMVVTASSAELEKFLEKYGSYEQLYNGGESLTLRK